MCTDRTLNEHIKKYHDISAQIKALEELKKAEIDKFQTVRITERTDERKNKKSFYQLYQEQFEQSSGWQFVPFDELDKITSELLASNQNKLSQLGF